MTSNSAAKLKRNRAIWLGIFLAVLSALIIFNALRPSQEEKDFDFLKTAMSRRNEQNISPEEREKIRAIFERLSPESKDKLMREILRDRLQQMREETANLSDEEKYERIEKATRDFRKRFSNLSEEEKQSIKERLNSPEGREQFKKTLEFYSTEFTAKEREMLDPLVHEIIGALNKL